MKVVALSGGVGGARLVDGLAARLDPDELTVIVNTGDDFCHAGLTICPDLDTVMYTLAGRAPEKRGWGLKEETFTVIDGMRALGGPTWFSLSDQDLATHLTRAAGLAQGQTLSAVTAALMAAHKIAVEVLPMCDHAHPTRLRCGDEILAFQDWFVARGATPTVDAVLIPDGLPGAAICSALEGADVIVFTPSNPFVSIDPILSLTGVRAALARRRGVCVAVSPIVAGAALKGPLAGLIESLQKRPASAAAVADYYGPLVDGWLVQPGDEAGIVAPTHCCDVVMTDRAQRKDLAGAVLAFAGSLE